MASPSIDRVNQHLLTSLVRASLHRLAAKLSPPPSPSQPIRSPSFTQPLKPGESDWTEHAQHAGRGRGVPHSLSLSLFMFFIDSVCDSSRMSDCNPHPFSPDGSPHPQAPSPNPSPPFLPTPPHLQDSTWNCGNFYFQMDFFSCSNCPCWAWSRTEWAARH